MTGSGWSSPGCEDTCVHQTGGGPNILDGLDAIDAGQAATKGVDLRDVADPIAIGGRR